MGRARVLVVEDEGDLRQPLAELLEAFGFDVATAANGLDALRSARGAPPDAIVLDLMMPVMNGWEFLRVQREDPRLAGIPVIVMSAAHPAKVEAAHYVDKPFDVKALAEVLARLSAGGERASVPASVRPE